MSAWQLLVRLPVSPNSAELVAAYRDPAVQWMVGAQFKYFKLLGSALYRVIASAPWCPLQLNQKKPLPCSRPAVLY